MQQSPFSQSPYRVESGLGAWLSVFFSAFGCDVVSEPKGVWAPQKVSLLYLSFLDFIHTHFSDLILEMISCDANR